MKNLLLTIALTVASLTYGQEIKSKKASFNLDDIEYSVEITIPSSLVKGTKVSIDGAKALKFLSNVTKDGKPFAPKNKSQWIMLFKRNGFDLTYNDMQSVVYKGKSNGTVTTLIFEKL